MMGKDTEIVIAAFSEDHVQRLTGISKLQLRYWDRIGFFRPAFGAERRTPFSRIYSFKDVVSLRVLNVLRNQYKVSLQHLREVAEELSHLADDKWTATELFVLKRKVVFLEPGTERHREVVGGQYVMGLPLKTVLSDTREAVAKLREREPAEVGAFERKRNVTHNALVIAGTRIPVATIKEFAEAGYTVPQILREYPTITKEDVEAVLAIPDTQAA